MKKKQFIRKVAKKSGMAICHAEKFYNAFVDAIVDIIVDEDKINLQGVGTIMGIVKEAHEYHNMHTGKNEMAPEKKTIKFIPSGSLIKFMNNK